MSASRPEKNPFIAGNWVRGDRFFGRQAIIEEVLTTARHALWVAGTRRFGKTSLLKQIEYVTTSTSDYPDYLPLLWDLQGSRNITGLKESLLESIEEAWDRFEDIGLDIEALEDLDLFAILRELKRKVAASDCTLLLLCDEAEELINIDNESPEMMPKLRRFLQRGENLRVVLCATPGLARLNDSPNPQTSPFLHGFVPPIYLTPIEETAARDLLNMGSFSACDINEILGKTNRHPYLMQLICARLFDNGNLVKVIEDICADRMIANFFAVDFQNLQSAEMAILLYLQSNRKASLDEICGHLEKNESTTSQLLFELSQLGLIDQKDNRFAISNYFFRIWLDQASKKPESAECAISGLPQSGDILGGYEILTLMGTGGMGAVYQACDPMLKRLVALKVLLPEFHNDPEFRQRFFTEARAASALNHPNVETIFQIGESEQRLFIAMELVDGKSLSEWHQSHKHDLVRIQNIVIQLAEGLAHAHDHNIVHRDFKPDNVMVTRANVAKILDFGLAKTETTIETTLTRPGQAIGTPAYMSPEQANGLPADKRTDIFAFGIVIYELFSGKQPFTGRHDFSIFYAILHEEPQPLTDTGLPKQLQALILKALQKNPDDRYQDMNDLLRDMRKIQLV